MPIENEKIQNYNFLKVMYQDGYFPNFLVDKIKAILLDLCEEIEANQPLDEPQLLEFTHAATEHINDLQDEFENNDSELETEARESMGADFDFIVKAYGFDQVDIEDVIAPRDW